MAHRQVFFNADVVTMDKSAPRANAFAVIDSCFYGVGSNQEIIGLADGTTEMVDLAGKTVVPGFIETHAHPSMYGLSLQAADCSPDSNATIEDVIRSVREKVDAAKPGQWVFGRLYDDTMIRDKRHLTRYDFDPISPHNPVLVFHTSAHLAYANSEALRIAGIGPDTPQPAGGELHKDENGVPTGLLKELSARMLILQHAPKSTVSQFRSFIQSAAEYAHRKGVTSIHDAGIGAFNEGPQVLKAYLGLAVEGKLTLRTYLTIREQLYQRILELGLGTGLGSDVLKIGAVKHTQDGSIQNWTAALSQPYHGRDDHKGELTLPQEPLDEFVEKFHKSGIQIAVHANGDAAIDSVIRAIDKAQQTFPRENHRHMIIHCQTARQDQLTRIKALGIIPSYFVNHVYYWGDRHASTFLGPERASQISPLGSSVRNRLVFTLHSDLPVTPIDPLHSIHNAVNRITRDGKVLGETECIDPLTALKAYTIWAAYCSFEETRKGSITAGKLADFTILSGSPLEVEAHQIRDIRVEQTYVGGRRVFSAEQTDSFANPGSSK